MCVLLFSGVLPDFIDPYFSKAKNDSVQLTAKLAHGQPGLDAASLAVVEPTEEAGRFFKNQGMEELRVRHCWRRQSFATLMFAQVPSSSFFQM